MSDASQPGAEPAPKPFRILPRVTVDNEHYWRGGEAGELRITRCQACGYWIHPTGPICPRCFTKDVAPEPTSGQGTVVAKTVNHQAWIPSFDPPYSLAIVELDDQPDLRITTNVVGIDPAEVTTGLAVQVWFEHHDDGGYEVWIPLFAPTGADPAVTGALVARTDVRVDDRTFPAREADPGSTLSPDAPRLRSTGHLGAERRAIVSGIGQSQIGRRIYRNPLDLTVDACLAAIADAGLAPNQIDGIATYPGNQEIPPGFTGAGVVELQEALRLNVNWFAGGLELPGQLGAVVNAVNAVATGLCDHVLCFRTVWEASAQGDAGRASVTMGGGGGGMYRAGSFMQWTLPYAAPSAAIWIGMMADRHFHEFGTTREQLGAIAVNARRNAGDNPNAIYRDPMTLQDYLDVRMISTPLCLYDCDVPADGSTAFVISRAEHAAGLDHPAARVESMGTALRGRPSWDQFDDLTTMALRDAAAMVWERTDLTPGDVDVAQLYDGFSFITLCWLEALGFCGHGEGGAFIEGGANIAREGVIPVNTHGGQLSAGRLHGFGFLHEACVQLWGRGGDRQVVRRGGDPEVAVAAAGGGPLAGALLLTR